MEFTTVAATCFLSGTEEIAPRQERKVQSRLWIRTPVNTLETWHWMTMIRRASLSIRSQTGCTLSLVRPAGLRSLTATNGKSLLYGLSLMGHCLMPSASMRHIGACLSVAGLSPDTCTSLG